ncbi:methylmalonic aciduria type A protein, mitochondrial-like isoform X2 [Dermacentor andersoni]|uniref:methylmalonic aciduria type A protein, mitochondrial-like isoform X2 n=1 Tax=Dermacentor andersoni TaxID=34620 RepID=UPI003B3B1A68
MLLVQVTSRVLRAMPKPLCQLNTKRGSCVAAATEAIESERIRRLFDGLTAGDRASLAQSITLVESTARKDHDEAQELLQLVLQENKGRRKARQLGSFRIGSLLGDKTRMIQLTRDPNAYIRPSPTRGHSGGVTRTTCDAIQLCECAGYNVVLVETVGVGQSEYIVADMVDLFLLLIPPGGGDELQGVKRGIVEMADLIAVTKADGDNIPECRRMAAEYVSALKFMKPRSHLWRPKVLQVSAKANVGISELWGVVQNYRDALEPNGELSNRRQQQRVRWLWTYVGSELKRQLRSHPGIAACTAELENAVIEEAITPGHACDQLISHFFKGNS